MKISIKQYKYEKIELADKEVELPDTTAYYFQTGIRRAIRIVPRWTTWCKKQYGKDEYIYDFEITCVYNSMECKIEKFTITPKGIEEMYFTESGKNDLKSTINFVKSWIDGDFNIRTKEQFEADLHFITNNL